MSNKEKFTILALEIFLGVILSIYCASYFGRDIYFLFYHLTYGVILSVTIPLVHCKFREKGDLKDFGIKVPKAKEWFIAISFIIFSIGGQLINIKLEKVPFNLLALSMAPLIMTTFFEEFLFRGFIQTRVEKLYGNIIAIIISGGAFSLYHLGYPPFRNFKMLLVLFLVGMMFAIAYRMSGNNLVISYFVNLTNAILTYLLAPNNFPTFDLKVTIVSTVTIMATLIILVTFNRSFKK